MEEFVQYHNPEYAGFPEETSEPFSVYTSKRIDDIHGSRVWLVARKPDTSEYYLVYWFIVDDVVHGKHEEPDHVNGMNGHWFRPALRIDSAPWFRALREHLGNFAFGLRRVTDAMLRDALLNLCSIDHGAFVDELEASAEPLLEGAVKLIRVNAYERNPVARRRCIEHYGAICSVCSFDFAATYGAVAEGIIHVHHLRPISECGGENYEVDPIAELRPVCPNCHVVLHRRQPPLGIEELRVIVSDQLNRRWSSS